MIKRVEIVLKLATNGQSDKGFLFSSTFVSKGLSAPVLGLYTCRKALEYIPGPGVRWAFTGPLVLWLIWGRAKVVWSWLNYFCRTDNQIFFWFNRDQTSLLTTDSVNLRDNTREVPIDWALKNARYWSTYPIVCDVKPSWSIKLRIRSYEKEVHIVWPNMWSWSILYCETDPLAHNPLVFQWR